MPLPPLRPPFTPGRGTSRTRPALAAFAIALAAAAGGCSRDEPPGTTEPVENDPPAALPASARPDSPGTTDPPAESAPAEPEAGPDAPVPTGHALLANERFYAPGLAEEMALHDPREDAAWRSEAVSGQVSTWLGTIAGPLVSGAWDGVTLPATPDFTATPVRPRDLPSPRALPPLTIRDLPEVAAREPDPALAGAEGLERALRRLAAPGDGAEPTAAFLKVIGMEPTDDEGRYRATLFTRLEFRGPAATAQENSRWALRVTAPEEGDLRIEGLALLAYQRIERATAGGEPAFLDVTARVWGDQASFRDQVDQPLDAWRDRLDWRFGHEVLGPHGLVVTDLNGDGRPDLFACETGGLPSRLYLQRPDGGLEDISAACGLDILEPVYSALFVDLDNDGDPDAALTSGRTVFIYENEPTGAGEPRFLLRHHHRAGSIWRSLTASDADLDGRLDLFACGYYTTQEDSVGLGRPMPYHDADNGAPNLLLHNRGGFRFEDTTAASGLATHQRFSYAAAWEDYDLDGDPDLYVANDFGRNNLYRNEGGRFVDVAAAAGVEDISAGMSVSWGDADGDGLADLYVGNMFSAAGNRIAYQRHYRSTDGEGTLDQFRRHARGNTLFRNRGDGTFEDVSVASGTTMGLWSWGSLFADINNDGREDLLVGNGMVTGATDSGDL